MRNTIKYFQENIYEIQKLVKKNTYIYHVCISRYEKNLYIFIVRSNKTSNYIKY